LKTFPKSERIALSTLFFSFGFFIMAFAPRNPDIKDNLDVTYGTFGTILGFGTLGAFIALMTMGHIIHKVGTYPVLMGSTAVMMATFYILANTTSPMIFFFVNIICGMSWSSYHISINTQTIHRQNELGINAIPHLHGVWTMGAVSSALLSSLIAEDISFAWHMNTLTTVVGSLMLFTIFKLRSICIPARDIKDEDGAIGFVEMIRSFRVDWVLSSAYLSVLALEITVSDWSVLFNRDVLGISKGIAIVPYIIFMSAMIIGRLGFNNFVKDREEYKVLKVFTLYGGVGFSVFLLLASFIGSANPGLAFTLLMVGFFMGGLGSSFLGPFLFQFAAKRSPRPDSVALAELSATNTALTLLYKLIIAWIAQALGLTAALLIPGIAFLLLAFYIRKVILLEEKR
jgi:fucose permease